MKLKNFLKRLLEEITPAIFKKRQEILTLNTEGFGARIARFDQKIEIKKNDYCAPHCDGCNVCTPDTIKLEIAILFGILAFVVIFIGVSVWRVM